MLCICARSVTEKKTNGFDWRRRTERRKTQATAIIKSKKKTHTHTTRRTFSILPFTLCTFDFILWYFYFGILFVWTVFFVLMFLRYYYSVWLLIMCVCFCVCVYERTHKHFYDYSRDDIPCDHTHNKLSFTFSTIFFLSIQKRNGLLRICFFAMFTDTNNIYLFYAYKFFFPSKKRVLLLVFVYVFPLTHRFRTNTYPSIDMFVYPQRHHLCVRMNLLNYFIGLFLPFFCSFQFFFCLIVCLSESA